MALMSKLRETHMRKDFHSDGIKIDTGHNSAGNGGDGSNTGSVTTAQNFNFSPYNKADVDIGAQDHHKTAWEAPVAPHDSGVTTSANQTNIVWSEQSQQVLAGVGGNGGNGNHAVGGIEVDLPHSLHSDMA
jgi:hypothetical protein